MYVPNGRTPDSDHYTYKLAWLAALRDALEPELAGHPQLAVCGDFNVAPTDADVWDPAAFVGATHVTAPEREALAQLRGIGLVDVLPRSLKGPNPFTYHDYRGGYFHKDMGMRIDLVYASARAGRSGRRRVHRPGGAQGQGPLRPRSGRGGPARQVKRRPRSGRDEPGPGVEQGTQVGVLGRAQTARSGWRCSAAG